MQRHIQWHRCNSYLAIRKRTRTDQQHELTRQWGRRRRPNRFVGHSRPLEEIAVAWSGSIGHAIPTMLARKARRVRVYFLPKQQNPLYHSGRGNRATDGLVAGRFWGTMLRHPILDPPHAEGCSAASLAGAGRYRVGRNFPTARAHAGGRPAAGPSSAISIARPTPAGIGPARDSPHGTCPRSRWTQFRRPYGTGQTVGNICTNHRS